MAKFTFDTEFIEDGKTIDLISIGIINIDTNEELYLISSDFDASKANEWVKTNVLSKLDEHEPRYTKQAIKSKILDFCGSNPEFYAYYTAYDWVVFCQIFGKMIDLPKGYPMLATDLKQEILRQGITKEQLPPDPTNEHNALDDARWNVLVYKQLYTNKLKVQTNKLENKVFLGGTCNKSTWRNELIPLLKIDYFNPVVDYWTEDCIEIENKEKATSKYELYVITPEQTGIYSYVELANSSALTPDRVICCFLNKDTLNVSQQKSINAIEKLIESNGSKVCNNLKEIAQYLNSKQLTQTNSNISIIDMIPEHLHFQETIHDKIYANKEQPIDYLKFSRDA